MANEITRVLLIEDNFGDARLIQELLAEDESSRFTIEWSTHLKAGLRAIEANHADVILLDLSLPDSQGMETVRTVHSAAPALPIIVLTGLDDKETALISLREGAQDYLVKGEVNTSLFTQSITYAVERQRMRTQIETYAHDLEEANHFKELFLDILRHDLLGPVNQIQMAIQLLEMDSSSANAEIFDILRSSAQKLQEMIESASLYARVQKATELERQKLDINEILFGIVHDFRPLMMEKSIQLMYLPSGRCYAEVSPMISNVFSNLVSNAIKYSSSEKPIEINILDVGENYRVYVKDWGFGISDEDKPRLFTRFQRVDKKGVKGTGLGLAVVKRLVELHAGRVWIENNPEGGSVFWVELPKNATSPTAPLASSNS